MNLFPELRGRGEAEVAEVDVVLQREGELALGEAVGLRDVAAVQPLDVRLVGEDARVVRPQEVLEVRHLGEGRKFEWSFCSPVFDNLLLWRQMQIVNGPRNRDDINENVGIKCHNFTSYYLVKKVNILELTIHSLGF